MLSDTSKYAEQAQIFLILNQVDKNIKIQATHYKVKCIFERSEVPKAKKLVYRGVENGVMVRGVILYHSLDKWVGGATLANARCECLTHS